MATQVLSHLIALSLFVLGAQGWRCAKYQHYFSQQPDYIECLWDCCGNSFNRHCCAPIGIIVGCSIVGAVVVAALTVLMICWWHRRRARETKGPRLFHNRRHSHYPVAPTSVTRPAPMMQYGGPAQEQMYYPPQGPPPGGQYRQGPYRPPPTRSEKPPLPPDDYEEREIGPPAGGYRPPPPRSSDGMFI